ncbi:MAG: addiction module protein [Candidatus Binataceae bacterium]
MSHSARKILAEALLLAEDERAEVVAQLLDSLRPAGPSEARSDEDWIAEVERRARAALAGAPGLSWEQARAQVTEHLARK